jgi:ClpP class serine protease
VDDTTIILADISRKALSQVEEFVRYLLREKMGEEKAAAVAHFLTSGRFTHDYPITYEQLKELGLPVSTDLPKEIYALMELYPQPGQRRPSVQYIPLPYRRESDGKR